MQSTTCRAQRGFFIDVHKDVYKRCEACMLSHVDEVVWFKMFQLPPLVDGDVTAITFDAIHGE